MNACGLPVTLAERVVQAVQDRYFTDTSSGHYRQTECSAEVHPCPCTTQPAAGGDVFCHAQQMAKALACHHLMVVLQSSQSRCVDQG